MLKAVAALAVPVTALAALPNLFVHSAAYAQDSTFNEYITLKKIDEDCKPVSGVEFSLQWLEPIAGGPALAAGDDGNRLERTDANGNLVFRELTPGVYRVTENHSTVPAHLQPLTEPVTVTVVSRGAVTNTAPSLSTETIGKCAPGGLDSDIPLPAPQPQPIPQPQPVPYPPELFPPFDGEIDESLPDPLPQPPLLEEDAQDVPWPQPQPPSLAEPIYEPWPIPDPDPQPQPIPEPIYEPQPIPEPIYEPQPIPEPDPQPWPMPYGYEPADVVIVNKFKPVKNGIINITKVDDEVPNLKLQGAVFQVLDEHGNEIIDPQTGVVKFISPASDINGVATIADLPPGRYKLREITGVDNYELSNQLIDIDLTDTSKPLEIAFGNSIYRGTVTLEKRGVPTNEPLAGVQFTLTPKNAPGSSPITATTDQNGVASFANVRWGSYILTETSGAEPYVVDSAPREVEITENGQLIDVGQVANKLKTGNVSLRKQDADTNAPLANVTFALFPKDIATARLAYLAKHEGNVADPLTDPNWQWQDTPAYTAVSSDTGAVDFADVAYGDYFLRETAAPESYVLDTADKTVSIREAQQVINLGVIGNSLKRSDIKIAKQTAWGEPLAGAVFELRKDNQVIATASSDHSGIATFKNIAYGDYKVVETQAPEGFRVDRKELDVAVRVNGAIVDSTATPFINHVITGNFAARKVDADDSSKAVNGAQFGLFANDFATARLAMKEKIRLAQAAGEILADPTGDPTWDWQAEILYSATSDDLGNLSFTNVVYGSYGLREIAAPEAYLLNAAVLPVAITEHGQVLHLGNITNQIKRADVTLRKVNEQGEPLAGADFELRNKNTAEVVKATSNAAGDVIFKAIAYGEYELVEVKAPVGYEIEAAARQVVVQAHGVTVEIGDVKNRKVAAAVIPAPVNPVPVAPIPPTSIPVPPATSVPPVTVPTPPVTSVPPATVTPAPPAVGTPAPPVSVIPALPVVPAVPTPPATSVPAPPVTPANPGVSMLLPPVVSQTPPGAPAPQAPQQPQNPDTPPALAVTGGSGVIALVITGVVILALAVGIILVSIRRKNKQ